MTWRYRIGVALLKRLYAAYVRVYTWTTRAYQPVPPQAAAPRACQVIHLATRFAEPETWRWYAQMRVESRPGDPPVLPISPPWGSA